MKATRAILATPGGPDTIEWEEVELAAPGPGEVMVEHSAVGLNFIDTYHRSGLYPLEMPTGLGLEAAGRVVDVGDGVTQFTEGDRVATFGPAMGAYATARNVAADTLFAIPEGISEETAAGASLKAATVEAFIERCARIEGGQTVLVHAAAGGVGQIMVQWLKAIGATVIGTTSSDEKESLARRAGADHVIRYDHEEIAPRVKEITGGAGVPVVFDGVGAATFEASLDSLSPRGLMVSFGNASGAVEGVNLGILSAKGSVFVTRPTLFHYYASPEERKAGMERVWDMIGSGKIAIEIGQTYPLQEAAQAHRDLEARKTTGSTILIP